ncbi:Uncharacterized protein OBRU01_18555, partial [Operophtera brumata]
EVEADVLSYNNAAASLERLVSTPLIEKTFHMKVQARKQLTATNAMLDQYHKYTLPTILQELEEILTDVTTTVSEAICQEGEIVSEKEAMPPVLRGEMLLDRMGGTQARLSYEQLRKDAQDLEIQINQLQDNLESLSRLQSRGLESNLYSKVNEIQEDISIKKYDYRATQLHLAAVRAQVRAIIENCKRAEYYLR